MTAPSNTNRNMDRVQQLADYIVALGEASGLQSSDVLLALSVSAVSELLTGYEPERRAHALQLYTQMVSAQLAASESAIANAQRLVHGTDTAPSVQ